MNLLVFRHGAASPGTAPGERDADRPLTKTGYEEFEAAAATWARIAPPLDLILTSSLLRACQTAGIVARVCGADVPVRQRDDLRPESDSDAFLVSMPRAGSICIVGHMPFVGDLIGRLAAGSSDAHVPMAPGMGVLLDCVSRCDARIVAALTTAAARATGP